MSKVILAVLTMISLASAQPGMTKSYSSASFRIRYEKSVSLREAKAVGARLDTAVSRLTKRFGIPFHRKCEVLLFDTPEKLRRETRSLFFDDAVYKNNRIYVVTLKAFHDTGAARDAISRVVTEAVLFQLPFCPGWLVEAYSLYAGNALGRFNRPSGSNLLRFHDLTEDYERAESADDKKELYAQLAATIGFLVDRYGEKKVESIFAQFQDGSSLEQVFESTFGEKIGEIERAWVKAVTPRAK